MNGNPLQCIAEPLLGAPEVIRLLHPKPQSGAVIAETAQPKRHLRRDSRPLGHDPMKRLAGDAKLAGSFAHRKAKRRQYVLTQDRAGVGRRPRQFVSYDPLRGHRSPSMILFEVNVPGIRVAPFKGYAPWAVNVEAVTLRFALEWMAVEAGNVEVAERRRMFERVQSPKRTASEFRCHLAT